MGLLQKALYFILKVAYDNFPKEIANRKYFCSFKIWIAPKIIEIQSYITLTLL